MRRTLLLLLIANVLACGPGSSREGSDDTGQQTPAAKKRVFATGSVYDGDLASAGQKPTGLEAGDALCATAASAAGLGGQWKAWLSDSRTNAIDRIADVGPWVLLDGRETVAFNNRDQVSTTPLASIRWDEFGRQPSGGGDTDTLNVWTGSLVGGLGSNDHCDDWTHRFDLYGGQAGHTNFTGNAWTDGGFDVCSAKKHLYCFEQ